MKTKTHYWAVDIVRCVLVSAAAAVCVGLRVVKKGHEVRAVRELDAEMHEEYRWLKKGPVLVLADAKHGNRGFVKQQGDPYGKLLDTGHHHYYDDDEFSKRWSSAQLEQLMTAIQTLFHFVLSHFRHLHQVKILLVADIASGTMEMRLTTV